MEETLNARDMEKMCSSLMVIAEDASLDHDTLLKLFHLCHNKLLNFKDSKLVRKFGISICKSLLAERSNGIDSNLWCEFFVMLIGLEEPQVLLSMRL